MKKTTNTKYVMEDLSEKTIIELEETITLIGSKESNEDLIKIGEDCDSTKHRQKRIPKWIYAAVLFLLVVLFLFWIMPTRTIPLNSISLSKSSLTLEEGESSILTVNYTPSDATDKSTIWESDDTTVAVVNNGVVTAVKAGKAIISVRSGGCIKYCNLSVTSKIIALSSISLSVTSLTLMEGATSTIVAKLTPPNATDKVVTWKSTDSNIATVDRNGNITAIKEGEVNIIASCGGKSASCNVQVLANYSYFNVVEDYLYNY